MVTHHIGGRVSTIEVSTLAAVGDMKMHCSEKAGRGMCKLLPFFTELLTEYMSLDRPPIPWELDAQKGAWSIYTSKTSHLTVRKNPE